MNALLVALGLFALVGAAFVVLVIVAAANLIDIDRHME